MLRGLGQLWTMKCIVFIQPWQKLCQLTDEATFAAFGSGFGDTWRLTFQAKSWQNMMNSSCLGILAGGWPNAFGEGWLVAKCIWSRVIGCQIHLADNHGFFRNPVTLSQIHLAQKNQSHPVAKMEVVENDWVSGNPVIFLLKKMIQSCFSWWFFPHAHDWIFHSLGICDWVSRNRVTICKYNSGTRKWLIWEFFFVFSVFLFFLFFFDCLEFYKFVLLNWIIKNLRHLDNDMHTVMKSAEEFLWDRIPFVLEAAWTY